MTNEKLEEAVMNLTKEQAEQKILIQNLAEDVKTTKSLAEDVHEMTINLTMIQKTQNNMNKKIESTDQKLEELSNKEFKNYQENKKIIKNNILSAFAGAIGTGLVAITIWFVSKFIK